MDGDGEDRAEDVYVLLAGTELADICVARRGRRFSGIPFSLGLRLFRIVARFLTGLRMDFGNFSALTPSAQARLAGMSSLGASYPASVLKCGASVTRVRLDRGRRIEGRSKMNLTSLWVHAFGFFTVFRKEIVARLSISSVTGLFVGVLSAIAIIVWRLVDDRLLLGWATLVLGLLVLALGQVFFFLLIANLIAGIQSLESSSGRAAVTRIEREG